MISHMATICILVALAALTHGTLSSNPSQPLQRRVPKQIHTKAAVVETDEDHNPAESFGAEAATHGHGKYFMYQHVPHKDHYEFGYRRGNDHHFKERYEKAHPHHGHFKTKARWGDKHGGYGEHYWDYNHGGHHGDDEASDDEGGDGSNPIANYHLKEEEQEERVKREHERRRPSASSEFFDHQGQETVDSSRHPGSRDPPFDHQGLRLAYDVESGTVVDEATGKRFFLTPIN